jgi:transcription initiation factor IIE alpha subunit
MKELNLIVINTFKGQDKYQYVCPHCGEVLVTWTSDNAPTTIPTKCSNKSCLKEINTKGFRLGKEIEE